MGVSRSWAFPDRIGKVVRLAGLVAATRTTPTGNGETMCFVTLADEDGLFEATLFPTVYKRFRHELARNGIGPFVIEGRVESQYDALSVTVTRIE